MNLCGVARALTDLAFDAVEAVFFLFDSSKQADELWYRDDLVAKESEEEVTEPAFKMPVDGGYPYGAFANLCMTEPQSSSAAPPSAAAGDRPGESPSPPRPDVETPPGTPPLTADELLDASFAAHAYAVRCTRDEVAAKWSRLGNRLSDAAK